MQKPILAALLLAGALAGCATLPEGKFSDETLAQNASAGPLQIGEARVITDNDAAFLSKLKLVESARKSIDMMYYIYADDYSSSTLTKALIDAARRGVSVRLLVDYQTNYNRLDLFSMMEKRGNAGQGSLHVRFYNRPTRNIIQDAVYMTLGCGKTTAAGRPERCSADKLARIDKLFSEETVDGKPAANRDISNLNVGNSGLFLSGLYGKRPDVVALAVQEGQSLDVGKLEKGASGASEQDRENLKKLGKIYWQSRAGSAFQRL